jgi:hypothetical protein
MGLLKSMKAADCYWCSVRITDDEVVDCLPLYESLLSQKFAGASAGTRDGILWTKVSGVNALEDEEIEESVIAILLEAFPSASVDAPVYQDDVLGKLTFDDHDRHFVGEFEIAGDEIQAGDRVQLFLQVTTLAEIHPLARRARDVVLRWSPWWETFQRQAVSEFLALYNESWREYDESGDGRILTEQQFLKRVIPTTLHVSPNLSFELWCFTDGMFTEHGIVFDVSAADEITALIQ